MEILIQVILVGVSLLHGDIRAEIDAGLRVKHLSVRVWVAKLADVEWVLPPDA